MCDLDTITIYHIAQNSGRQKLLVANWQFSTFGKENIGKC